jgi:hypothetical protein
VARLLQNFKQKVQQKMKKKAFLIKFLNFSEVNHKVTIATISPGTPIPTLVPMAILSLILSSTFDLLSIHVWF